MFSESPKPRTHHFAEESTAPEVLVVDDEPQVCRMVALVLEGEGFSVTTAGNGPDAIALSRSHERKFDLLLTDVSMPGMDGPTLAKELRAAEPDLPVILMSGGCDDAAFRSLTPWFLTKPFSLDNLLRAVRSLAKCPNPDLG
jgi:CheY-like chemotaxis protein